MARWVPGTHRPLPIGQGSDEQDPEHADYGWSGGRWLGVQTGTARPLGGSLVRREVRDAVYVPREMVAVLCLCCAAVELVPEVVGRSRGVRLVCGVCGADISGHENNPSAVTNIVAEGEYSVVVSTPRDPVGVSQPVLEAAVTDHVDGPYGLQFGPSKVIMTARGERAVRNAKPTEEFWVAWRAHKDRLRDLGFGCRKNDQTGSWEVSLWDETLSVEQRQASLDASRATDAAIDIPIPEGLELLPYQRGGIAYALGREATLIGDEMGLGKTIQAIGVANVVKPQRVLVVCPASIKLNWKREIEKWQVIGLPVRVIYPRDVQSFRQSGWYIVNYDIIARFEQIKDEAWDLIVVDEAHRMKTRTAQRTVFIFGGTKKDREGKMVEVAPIPAKRKLLLTGTPIVNRPSEAFTILHYLDPARWPNYVAYRRRYCAGYDQGASNLDELQTRLRETVMVRRLKRDVLTELPAKIRQVVAIEPEDGEVRELVEREVRIYEETEAEIAASQAAIAKAKAENNEADCRAAVERLQAEQAVAFERISKVRHEVGQAKVPYVLRHLEEIEGKVLVFAHHEDVIDAIVRAQDKGTVVSITGKTAQDKRQGIVDQFQNDPNVTVFVGNIQAAGVGITLTASSHVVFAELDWVPGNVSQAEDRAHRIGQKDSVLVQHVVLDGSLDQRMATMIINKQKVIDAALDTGSTTATKLVVPAVNLIPAAEPKVDKVVAVAAAVKELPKVIAERIPEARGLTAGQVEAIHTALRLLAGMDRDGARILNGAGFSKYDTDFGRSLAAQSRLSPRQAEAAKKMVIRYRRQLSEELLARITGEAV